MTANAKGMKCPYCHKEIVLSESVGGEYLKTFEFLNNPEEDIYTENDGKPIKE